MFIRIAILNHNFARNDTANCDKKPKTEREQVEAANRISKFITKKIATAI
jgi:hypothetical protein